MATTTIKTALPELDWPDQAILTVDSGDPLATVSFLTIHLSQDAPDDLPPIILLPPVLAHTNGKGDNPGPRL